MSPVFLLVATLLAAAAILFAVLPALRGAQKPRRGRLVLAGALALAVIGVSGAAYQVLGRPDLAGRRLTGDPDRDLNAQINILGRRMAQNPAAAKGWLVLGRGYLLVGDLNDAVRAFERGLDAARKSGELPPGLALSYGEALARRDGAVGDEARRAFTAALVENPREPTARFFLAQDAAARGDFAAARNGIQGLLDDLPANSPGRGMLVDWLARLTAQSAAAGSNAANAPPNVQAMVANLAARLKSNPRDGEGWQRLVRAYSVLGDKDKARIALADGRAALRSDDAALNALNAEAARLGLN